MIGNIAAGLFGVGVPPVTSSYESIASTTTTGNSSYTFTQSGSAWSSYKHLQLRINWMSAANNGSLRFRFNGDTASNYSFHRIYGSGSSAAADSGTSVTSMRLGQVAIGSEGDPVAYIVDILDFASTSKNKTVRVLYGNDSNGTGEVGLSSGLWFKTPEAITSITFFEENSNTTSAGFHAALYGIKD